MIYQQFLEVRTAEKGPGRRRNCEGRRSLLREGTDAETNADS